MGNFNKNRILLSLLLLPFFGVCQGIHFENISLEQALQKAKEENKLVFIDFHTVWCGPCKKMARDIFPLQEVGEFYNKNFINLKLDAEKEGQATANKYNVTGFPTLLYLDTEGKVLLKDTAFNPKDEFLLSGQRALASLNSAFSLENLQNQFPNRKNDEQFLKMYIKKMNEFGQPLTEAIDAWLKVQTEMEASSSEMKNYLMKNTRYFVLGGKGEQILNENMATYLESATPFEAKMLPRLKTQILNNTLKVAEADKNPELMKRYIEAYKQQPENRIDQVDLIDAELSYLILVNDDEGFKTVVENYVDSLMHDKPISEIKAKDNKMYQRYKAVYDKDPVELRKRMMIASKEGLEASKILKEINNKGKAYLERITSRKESKILNSWIKYGYKLKEENCYTDDLKAEVYYKNGKKKKAIKLKERAIKNWTKYDKKFVNKEYELNQMRKGLSK